MELVKAEAKVAVKSHKSTESTLLLASENGDLDTLRASLQAGADVDTKDAYGRTPLFHASLGGYIDTVELLIEAGANVNVQDKSGDTSLLLASLNGHLDIVKSLIKARADIDAKGEFDLTPLNAAAKNGHVDIVELLIEAGANVNVQDTSGNTSLLLASLNGHVVIVEALIEASADIDVKGEFDLTPINAAAKNGHVDIVKLLIEAGAKLNVQDFRYTPLRSASLNGHVDVVELLIEAGVNVNVQDKSGNTALYLASLDGYVDIVKSLIKARANVNVQNKSGDTPLDIAIKRDRFDVVRALVTAGAIYTKVKDKFLIIHASHQCSVDMVELLIEAGANVNEMDEENYLGYTALHIASFKGRKEVVETLLETGADINAENKDGKTAFSLPYMFGRNIAIFKDNDLYTDNRKVIELLISHIVRLEAASLYVSEKNLQIKDELINTSQEWRNNYLQHSRICKEEIEKLRSENITLFEFLTESDINQLCSIWEKNECVSSNFYNQENIKSRYPEYDYILINKANEIRKEIFLHNHRPLVDVLSIHYECDVNRMTFIGLKTFFNAQSADFKEKLGNGGLTLCSFVDFQDLKEKHIPKLKVEAFKNFLSKCCTN